MIVGKKLEKSFYLQTDVVQAARSLLGKKLVTAFNGRITSGIIIETEAYNGINDRASHSFGGKITRRNEVMYSEGGVAYVYLCYGIHSLFNVVTNVLGIPDAVLVRGIILGEGTETMLERTGKKQPGQLMGNGPGKVSKLLGIHYSHSGLPLTSNADSRNKPLIWIEDDALIADSEIVASPRIGVDYAGEDALLPYRFCLDIKKAP
jgi:DNA-3-methyladenine glycosylase